MSDPYAPMNEAQRANVQDVIDKLTRVGEAIGGWTDKVEARETGATYRATFERKVDVYTTLEWAHQLSNAPALLADCCRKLLAADARFHSEQEPQ